MRAPAFSYEPPPRPSPPREGAGTVGGDPASTPEYISRGVDGGALGVIAPHIGSAAQARAVVAAARFPPAGERSAAGALPHLQFRSFPIAEAYAALNAATTVMVQFET